jgi:6-phospho-3-hexuloisomerase
MRETVRTLAEAASSAAARIDSDEARGLLDAVASARRVFLVGAGRTGLVARSFAIRLRQLGREAFVAGEAATPAPAPADLVVVCSASSRTPTTVAVAQRALAAGVPVAVITSPEGARAWAAPSRLVVVPVGGRARAAPLGTVFELALQLFLDAAIVELMARLGVDEASMRAGHSTLE